MLKGYHESVIATLFRPLTLELCSRPPSCFPAKYPSLNSNKTVLQISSPIAPRRVKERLCEVRAKAEGLVRYNAHPTKPHPLLACGQTHTHRHPWVYPAGRLLKQTTVLWAVSCSVSGPDEDGARLFFLFRDVMGFYSCLCA